MKDAQTLTATKTDAIASQTRTEVDACEMSAPCLVGCVANFVTACGAQSNRYHVTGLPMSVMMTTPDVENSVK